MAVDSSPKYSWDSLGTRGNSISFGNNNNSIRSLLQKLWLFEYMENTWEYMGKRKLLENVQYNACPLPANFYYKFIYLLFLGSDSTDFILYLSMFVFCAGNIQFSHL